MHICVSKLTIIGSDNAVIWTNAGVLLIGDILIRIHTLSFKKINLKMEY